MRMNYLLGALALTVSTATFAAEPAPAPGKDCCCCNKDEHGKMACCKEKDVKPDSAHDGQPTDGMQKH